MTTSARRQLFRRSKAGCWNCRSKKKKCDELRPHCTRCIRAGENCRYPDTSSESLLEANIPVLASDYASPGLAASASFPSSLSMHAAPMLSRSSSTSGYSSQHPSRHSQHQPYPHHPYATSSGSNALPPQHRDYHQQRQPSLQRPSSPVPGLSHHSYYPASHNNAQPSISQQQLPPPPLSASAAADWDHTSQQQVFKRARYEDFSSSSSSTSSNPQYQDSRARQPFDAHHRISSNQSQASSKGKSRDILPPFSPKQAHSVAMAPSASLPNVSPDLSSRSANASAANHASPAFASVRQVAAHGDSAAPETRIPVPPAYPPTHPTQTSAVRGSFDPHPTAPPSDMPHLPSNVSQSPQKLVFDYASTEPDPEELIADLSSLSLSVVTQPTKGAKAYFKFLVAIARMSQGRAMAHALAAHIATRKANIRSKRSRRPQGIVGAGSHTDDKIDEPRPSSPGQAHQSNGQPMNQPRSLGASADENASQLLELADRHHLAAIKALQTQHQPSRRRRFSVIESTASNGAEELPIGSNAAAMLLLILACSSAGKSLMLPSYFNQCEQFLADAVEHVSSHRLFPSVTGEPIIGTPEEPPSLSPENLSNYGGLLFLGTVVSLYECYLSQYTAVTNWDYNPSRLRRLSPYNWNDSDAALFEETRGCVAETMYSVSMVTLELVIETLDTMRKFKRAEAAAYGSRKSSRSEAEDGVAALESLALREELGLLIRDLEAGTFWKGTVRILSDAEQLLILDTLAAESSRNASKEVEAELEQDSQMSLPTTGKDTGSAAITKAFQSGSLFLLSESGEHKRVNRLRLANHLYRNALVVDLYVTVFNRPPNSLAVRELVSRSISLLDAVPEKLELGLMWPALVLGSYAQGTVERSKVRTFVERAQQTGNAGSAIAFDVIERVWAGDADSWRESVTYFGSPFLS